MGRKYIDLNKLLDNIKRKTIKTWFDKFNFFHIFSIWIFVIIAFGLIYHFSKNNISYLYYNPQGKIVTSVLNSIYFSFESASAAGFGDVVPFGFFKVIAIFEVIGGLILLAIVVSKLVSIKQNKILGELYDLSFNERINRIRSSMLLFRQNIDRLITKIEEGTFRKREIDSVYIYLSSFEDILNEIINLTRKSYVDQFVKNLDPISTELLFISIINSFEKLYELITIMNQSKIDWKPTTVNFLNECVLLNDHLFEELNSSKNLLKQTINDLNSRKNKIISKIKDEINSESAPSNVPVSEEK